MVAEMDFSEDGGEVLIQPFKGGLLNDVLSGGDYHEVVVLMEPLEAVSRSCTLVELVRWIGWVQGNWCWLLGLLVMCIVAVNKKVSVNNTDGKNGWLFQRGAGDIYVPGMTSIPAEKWYDLKNS